MINSSYSLAGMVDFYSNGMIIMIEFKQKEFKTGIVAKAAFRKGNIKEGLKEFKSIMNKDYLKPGGAASKKTKYQLMRDAVEEEHKFKGKAKEGWRRVSTKQGWKDNALDTYKKGKDVSTYLHTNTPGSILSDAVGKAVEASIATGGTAFGYASVPMFKVYVPGTTPASVGADMWVRKHVPVYDRASKYLDTSYKKSRGKRGYSVKDYLSAGVDSMIRAFPA